MGQQQTIQKCNFEDVQDFIKNDNGEKLIINTMSSNKQNCLIQNTVQIKNEEGIINNALNNNTGVHIIIYGENSNDNTIYDKYKKLYELGFYNIYIYVGGLFEWLCLQDIYGKDEFPTTSDELDLFKYRPSSYFHQKKIK
jgi:hypothetical protein